ncbi:MAG: hypothetical protein WA887_05505 [Carnobacterium jeotgali]|uniref:hypothetical protein n=1 Tax=Carnobacterium jeotgali TaxID=545534 RepID=UPI003C7718E3
MDKQFEGVYQSMDSLLEKVTYLLESGHTANQLTLVTNKDKEDFSYDYEMAIPRYENDPILLEKITRLIQQAESDDIFSLEKYGLTKETEKEQYNQAMFDLTYVLLLGESSDNDYWYPKKRLGRPVTVLEENKEFNHQSDFINSGSANSDISSPRFNGSYNNQAWMEPNSDRQTTRR